MRPRILVLVVSLVLAALPLFGQASDCTTTNPSNCDPNTHGAPVPFSGDSGPVRYRKSIFDLSQTELDRYQKAITAYRNLKMDDPRSWCRQANVHCYNCSAGGSTVEVHFTYAFLPWHRAYLYFYEKILGELVGDPTFALPYWDWNAVDTPECQAHYKLPAAYTTGSLVDANRRKRGPNVTMSPTVVGAETVNDIITGNPLAADFLGTATEDSIMWPTPHGPVHNWVGLAPPKYFDMGDLATAARDPIFFAHHNNIDRIWSDWATYYGVSSYPADFNAQVFTFFDEKKQWRSITAADVTNLANLNVVFVPPQKCSLPISASSAAAAGTLDLTAEAPTTVAADIREVPQVTATTGRFAGKRVVLHVDDVDAPQIDDAVIRVFLNKADANAETSIKDPHFVAQFAHVHSSRAHEGHADANDLTFRLDAEHLRIIEEAGGQVQVTFVAAPTTRSDLNAETAEPIPAVRVRTAKPFVTVEDDPSQ